MKRFKVTILDIYYVDAESKDEAINLTIDTHYNAAGKLAEYSHGDAFAEEQ